MDLSLLKGPKHGTEVKGPQDPGWNHCCSTHPKILHLLLCQRIIIHKAPAAATEPRGGIGGIGHPLKYLAQV